MNAAMIFPGSGPIVILTSHEGLEDPSLLERLAVKGIKKFIAFPLPLEVVRAKYGVHFDALTVTRVHVVRMIIWTPDRRAGDGGRRQS